MEEWHRALVHGTGAFRVLAVLAAGARHPYAIRQALIRLTGSRLVPSEGTLYPMLARLEKRGWVAGELAPGRGRQLRRIYRLTARGREELRGRIRVWQDFAKQMGGLLRHAGLA